MGVFPSHRVVVPYAEDPLLPHLDAPLVHVATIRASATLWVSYKTDQWKVGQQHQSIPVRLLPPHLPPQFLSLQ